MFATHDPRLVKIVAARAEFHERKPGSFEYQMLYGIRPDEQFDSPVRDTPSRLRSLRRAVVRLPHAATRRASREHRFFLRALTSRK